MAQKTPGTVAFSANLAAAIEGPLDARTTVENLTDLSSVGFRYDGMIVSVVDDATSSNNGVYFFLDSDNTWHKLQEDGSAPSTFSDDLHIDASAGAVDITSLLQACDSSVFIIDDSSNPIQIDISALSKSGTQAPFEVYHSGQASFSVQLKSGTAYDVWGKSMEASIDCFPGQYFKFFWNPGQSRFEFLVRSL
jgi:hypothetical protein